ncbi:MAG TPA: hypothetical protein VJB16_03340, partial [archaeon]|nr:hypothetical protein [archaeon]
ILATRPQYDDETAYLHAWTEDVLRAARDAGFAVIDLAGKKATRTQLESHLRKQPPALVLLNGHGDSRTVFGQDDEPIAIAGENHALFSSTVISALACESAQELGPACVSAGARAYIGYRKEFVFFIDTDHSSTPRKDPLAEPFFAVSNQVPLSLLRGKTAAAALADSKATSRKHIVHLLGSKDPESPFMLTALIDNLMNQELLGDCEARIA